MEKIKIGNIYLSRFILGSNPFSGFSHQGPEKDDEMKHYFNVNRIKEVMKKLVIRFVKKTSPVIFF